MSRPALSVPSAVSAILRLTWPERGAPLAAAGSLASVVGAGAQLLIPLVLGAIVDQALIARDRAALGALTLLLVALATTTFAAHLGGRVAFGFLEDRALAAFQCRLLSRVNTVPKALLDRWRASELHAFFTEDGPKLATLPGSFLGETVTTVAQAVGLLSLLVWKLGGDAALVAVLVPLYLVLPLLLSPRLRSVSRRFRDAGAATSSRIQDLLHATRELRIFGRERWAVDSLDPHFEARRGQRLRLDLLRASTWANYALTFLVGAAVYWYGGLLVFEGKLSVGELVAIVALLTYLESPVQSIVELNSRLQGMRGSLERLDPLLSAPAEPHGGEIELPPGRGMSLRFDRVGFMYDGSGADALRDLSFSVAAGSRAAVVGQSGAGKSTLVALLLRLYDATEGAILVDGRDVLEYSVHSLRGAIGFVPQDPLLLPGSIRDNVRLAAPEVSDAEIARCCRMAELHDLVEELPAGYDTEVGDQAVRLSGGQRQRLAVARALARAPTLLILDEGTAGLDTVIEGTVLDNLASLHGLTTLVITHRLHTVTDFDLILVLDAGRLVASGTHDHLLATCGLYAQLQGIPWPERAAPAGPQIEPFTEELVAP